MYFRKVKKATHVVTNDDLPMPRDKIDTKEHHQKNEKKKIYCQNIEVAWYFMSWKQEQTFIKHPTKAGDKAGASTLVALLA